MNQFKIVYFKNNVNFCPTCMLSQWHNLYMTYTAYKNLLSYSRLLLCFWTFFLGGGRGGELGNGICNVIIYDTARAVYFQGLFENFKWNGYCTMKPSDCIQVRF